MDPFERQIRNLPWQKKSDDLKERIFSSNSIDTEVKPKNITNVLTLPPLAWVAILCIIGSLITYMLFHNPNSAGSPPYLVQADIIGNNSQNATSFFDLSSQPETPWSGTLKLTIESN